MTVVLTVLCTLGAFLLFVLLLVAIVALRFALDPRLQKALDRCAVFEGRTTHTRLKGGAIHHLDYPIWLALLDLEQIESIGWALWPLFAVDASRWALLSLDKCHHMKDLRASHPDYADRTLSEHVERFLLEKAPKPGRHDSVQVLTNLSNLGYCFNPLSLYFLMKHKPEKDEEEIDGIIAEVSNTPWLEMHSYLLQEGVEGVEVSSPPKQSTSNKSWAFSARWKKTFHVSPFMEMPYHYHFHFSAPGDQLEVRAAMEREGAVWFTASVQATRLPFTPFSLMRLLFVYPFYTYMVQIYIHIEALKLVLKGVPTFNHPEGRDVDFGCGITGKRLGAVLYFLASPFLALRDCIYNKSKAD